MYHHRLHHRKILIAVSFVLIFWRFMDIFNLISILWILKSFIASWFFILIYFRRQFETEFLSNLENERENFLIMRRKKNFLLNLIPFSSNIHSYHPISSFYYTLHLKMKSFRSGNDIIFTCTHITHKTVYFLT